MVSNLSLPSINHSNDAHPISNAQEETFGPVIGIQPVSSDEEAIQLMNDSPYGLTASIWTNAEKNKESEEAFMRMVEEVGAGTVFLNRLAFSFLAHSFFLFVCVMLCERKLILFSFLDAIIWIRRLRGLGLRIVGGVLR